MRLTSRLYALASLVVALPILAQTTAPPQPMARDAHPSFVVATIKPHDPDSNKQGFYFAGDRVSCYGESLIAMMVFAYSVHPDQILGLPEWGHKQWDIEGTTDAPGEPNQQQQQEMFQKLLSDRFGLKLQHTKRELPVYAVEVAKGGPKLKLTAHLHETFAQQVSGHDGVLAEVYTSADMTDFALGENFLERRPVIDHTGLTGKYDFTLRYTYDQSKPSTDPNAPPGLFTAIQDQLGLKLVPTRAPVDVLVIDHVAQPTAN